MVGATNTLSSTSRSTVARWCPSQFRGRARHARGRARFHGRRAVKAARIAAVCERLPEERKDGATMRVADSAEALAIMAANFHASPARKLEARRCHRHQWQD